MSHEKATARSQTFKKPLAYNRNARENQKAFARMDRCQREVGLTEAEIVAQHREQRARVLQRYGLAA